jgi:hypothetical protein
MKALEILKDLAEHNTYDHLVSYRYTIEDVNQAITELETLQSPKTCNGCNDSLADGTSDRHSNICKFCARQGAEYYEPKVSK